MLLNYTEAEGDLSAETASDLLRTRLMACRDLSMRLTESLSAEDQVVQACEDTSPTKWHLAHTTWFFEELLLKPFARDYQAFDEQFAYCFNSYYEALGPRHPRPQRGLLTRPSLETVRDYRKHVDEGLLAFFSERGGEFDEDVVAIIETGINHEQQHQELLLMDILAVFAAQPLKPAYLPALETSSGNATAALTWSVFDGGLCEVGHDGEGFAYDNEGPRHQSYVQPFKLANRLVTNEEWLSFIEDGGYETVGHWLAEGWHVAQREGWEAPLYWERLDRDWGQMSLRGGLVPIDLSAPVCHVSYYEADAFARWSGKRLPTEFEWEVASQSVSMDGNFLSSENCRPMAAPAGASAEDGLQQMFGDVWEWTRSPYAPYPGYQPPEGAIGEYNGKFMCSQFVLRGGACVTPGGHIRRTYRNFFYPHHRWQFGGLRLADDV